MIQPRHPYRLFTLLFVTFVLLTVVLIGLNSALGSWFFGFGLLGLLLLSVLTYNGH